MTERIQASDQGLIFDIERFSTKDGPGIRTVVFFKGCNMYCYWCHNPESISREIELGYNIAKCTGCMACVKACPNNAIAIWEGRHEIDRTVCSRCFACTDVCYAGALHRIGRLMSIEEILSEILEDEVFYTRSGGGVTLSGGEVMLQSEFAARLLKRCKQEGIHTAIDSNMSVPWECFNVVLPYTDLMIADIKSMDDKVHYTATGETNSGVLENIRHINARGIPFIVRTPVIPGFNDSEDDIRSIAEFLRPFSVLRYYELISYNPLGDTKAYKIGKTDMPKIDVPDKETMYKLANIALEANIKVFVDGHEEKREV